MDSMFPLVSEFFGPFFFWVLAFFLLVRFSGRVNDDIDEE